jgi:hypothetical protein
MTWEARLDEMERRIAAVRQALLDNQPVPVFAPLPEMADALPVELARRARRVYDDTAACAGAVRQQMEILGHARGATRSAGTAHGEGRRAPVFVDIWV